MKIFSLGFIVAFVGLSFVTHLSMETMKDFFELLILIVPAIIVVIYFCWQTLKCIYTNCKHTKANTNINWQCLLIDGAWGSGKTTHYEKYYQYIDDKPNIYISCFSASRSELIAQIIQQQFWCKLLTLHGLLAKLMESNWQIFMPKNRVIVFDDLERLHASQDNYLDLIGVIDYLKNTNKCKIILICNMSELVNIDESKPNIFNAYMERVVDSFEYPELLSNDDFANNLIKNPDELTKNILNQLYSEYSSEQITNLRIIKEQIPKISQQINSNYNTFGEIENIVNGSIAEIKKTINLNYLFFYDNELFKDCVKLHTEINLEERGEEVKKLETKLYDYKLQKNNFYINDFKNSRDIMKLLQPKFYNFLGAEIYFFLNSNKTLTTNGIEHLKMLVVKYLEKHVNRQTCNEFDGVGSIQMLYIVYHLNLIKFNELYEAVLSQKELMNDVGAPKANEWYSLDEMLERTKTKLYIIFEISTSNEDKKGFLTKYFDYYHETIINNFIQRSDNINEQSLSQFNTYWFMNNHYSSIDYEMIDYWPAPGFIELPSINNLFILANKWVNLIVVNKWIEKGVYKNILLQYYCKAIDEFKATLDNKDEPYIKKRLELLIADNVNENLVEENDTNASNRVILMRDKFFRLKNLVIDYIQDDVDIMSEFNEFYNQNQEIIDKLSVQKPNTNQS